MNKKAARDISSSIGWLHSTEDTTPQYPERDLWASVIHTALLDYESWLQKISLAAEFEKKANRMYLNALRQIRYEFSQDWLIRICELIDIEPSALSAKFNSLDEKYRLSEVRFTRLAIIPSWRGGGRRHYV